MDMPIGQKVEACRRFRTKGNLFHEEGQYRRAALQYRQVKISRGTHRRGWLRHTLKTLGREFIVEPLSTFGTDVLYTKPAKQQTLAEMRRLWKA